MVFQMDNQGWITMEELLEDAAQTEEEDRILDRLKLLAQESLPVGWKNWKTLNPSMEDLFGAELEVDPQILNKLRFALPTVGIAKAFNPSAVDLPEKQYRDFKVNMLRWSFCRALIISPPCLVNKVKGSAAQAEIFLHAAQSVKPLCISRKAAAEELKPEKGVGDEDSEDTETEDPQNRSRKRSAGGTEMIGAKRSRYVVLEEQMNNIFSILMEKIDDLKENRRNNREENGLDDDGDGQSQSDSQSDSEDDRSAISNWTPPGLEDPPVKHANDLEALSLVPQVKEKEPTIPPPSEIIKEQGISCQKLGSASWNKIRYKEVQKKLHASPVFDTLKVNPQLENVVQKSYYQILLERMDEMAGTITHGLLKQRQQLKEGLRTLASKHPEAYESIKEVFVGESPFKETSDDLLQFTCAKRAEVFEMRRKVFKPKDLHHAAKLAEIPPSVTHLFDEELLSKFLDQRGGMVKVFPTFRQPLKDKPYYNNKGNFSQKPGGSGNTSAKKTKSHSTSNNSFRRRSSKDSRKDFKRNDSSKSRDRRTYKA